MSICHNRDKRILRQQWLWPIVVIVIALGWKYLFGFTVPVVMIAGIMGSIAGGRYICGNWCPRGAFLDQVLAKVSLRKTSPKFLQSMNFRVVILIAMMGFMSYQISQNTTSLNHWGFIFWVMCTVTTFIAVVLGIIFQHRSWCMFCPMGTMQNWIGGKKASIRIDSQKCVMCRACEKACPMNIPIVSFKEKGVVDNRDCIKCLECVNVCPQSALR